jgi:signal transduction histidine kinase
MGSMAAAVGALVFAVTALFQWLFAHLGWNVAVMLWVSDAMAGLFAGLLSLRLMNNARERQQAVAQRLRMVAEMNHEVRNALELIQLSAHMTHDQETISSIGTAVERIQRTLREVLDESPNGDSPLAAKPKH